jgi:hypothetical protein
VPLVGLSNISLKFREDTLFERTAIYEPSGIVFAREAGISPHPRVQICVDTDTLRRVLRQELEQQAAPIVEALYQWSGFSRKGSWGMITSSWASQYINVCGHSGSQTDALPVLSAFFDGYDEIARMKPRLNPVTLREVTHLYQRRASCCRYYLHPQGDLSASCPLVSDAERTSRNLEWMEQQLNRVPR